MQRQFKFNKKTLDALGPCPADLASGEVEYSDTDVAGLRLVVNRLGRKRFLLRYSLSGAKRSMKLGEYPALDLAQARQLAMSARLQIAQGVDPQATQPVHAAPDALTLADFMALHYLPYAQGANRSYRDILGRWSIHLAPVFGQLALTELRTQDIQRFHDAKRTELCAASANRLLALLKRALNLALLWGLGSLTVNPVKGVRMHLENNQRQRYLVGDELRRFLAALDQEPNRSAAQLLKFLLATGVRRTEALTCRWEDLDLDQARWLLPTSKNGRSRFVVLNAVALEILREQRRVSSGLWVFPSPIDANKHLGDPKKAFARACHSARIEPGLVIHSLRHSYASHLVQSGQSLQVVQSLLGHRQIGTTARYAHLSADQLHQAASQVSLAMSAAMR